MKLPRFIKIPEHNRFQYTPVYYDPRKEALEQKINQYKADKKASENEEYKPDFKGKFVLVDFWATWCGPCRRAIPELNTFHKKYKDRLVVMGVSKQVEGEVRGMKTPVIDYYSAIDTQDRMGGELKIKGIPHIILIDPEGIVRWEGFPLLEGYELTEKVLEQLLDKYK